MKIRSGFVSNSSSSSFLITNKTNQDLTILDFALETTHLVEKFNDEYPWNDLDVEVFIEDAEEDPRILKPGVNQVRFGDEDGTVMGEVFDYMLREGGETTQFSWKFFEYNR